MTGIMRFVAQAEVISENSEESKDDWLLPQASRATHWLCHFFFGGGGLLNNYAKHPRIKPTHA